MSHTRAFNDLVYHMIKDSDFLNILYRRSFRLYTAPFGQVLGLLRTRLTHEKEHQSHTNNLIEKL